MPLTIGVASGVMLLFQALRFSESIPTKYLSSFEFAFVSFLLPIYLAVIHSFIVRENRFAGEGAIYALIMIASILLACWIDYDTWSSAEKKFLDAESRDVVEIGLFLQFILALIVGGCAILFSGLNKKFPNATGSR